MFFTLKTSEFLWRVFQLISIYRNGAIMEQPLGYELNDTYPVLFRPETSPPPPPPCYVYINVSKLRGYTVVGMSVTSESRTVEWYIKDEYIGTKRGTGTNDKYVLFQMLALRFFSQQTFRMLL